LSNLPQITEIEILEILFIGR